MFTNYIKMLLSQYVLPGNNFVFVTEVDALLSLPNPPNHRASNRESPWYQP